MALTYLALSGSSTATFADGAGGATWFRVESDWAPRVSRYRQAELGGYGPYEDVVEDIPISIGGSTAAHAYANISTLEQLALQAQQWARGEAVGAVTVLYSPAHATVSAPSAPLAAAVRDMELALPPVAPIASASASQTWIQGARLRIVRSGEWLLQRPPASAAASPLNGEIGALSFGATHPYRRPIRFGITNGHYPATSQPQYFVVAESQPEIVNAEALSTIVGPFYAESDGGLRARGGSVLRYTPLAGSLLWDASPAYTLTGAPSGETRFHVLVSARNATPDIGTMVRVAFSESGGLYQITSKPVSIDSSNSMWYSLGEIVAPYPLTRVRINAYATSTGGSLYMDSLLIVYASRPYIIVGWHGETLGGGSLIGHVTIDPARLTSPYPLLTSSPAGSAQLIYRDTDILFYSSAGVLYAGMFQTPLISGTPYFRPSTTGSTPIAASAYEAWLTPV